MFVDPETPPHSTKMTNKRIMFNSQNRKGDLLSFLFVVVV
jgi:hypothetical protein